MQLKTQTDGPNGPAPANCVQGECGYNVQLLGVDTYSLGSWYVPFSSWYSLLGHDGDPAIFFYCCIPFTSAESWVSHVYVGPRRKEATHPYMEFLLPATET